MALQKEFSTIDGANNIDSQSLSPSLSLSLCVSLSIYPLFYIQ